MSPVSFFVCCVLSPCLLVCFWFEYRSNHGRSNSCTPPQPTVTIIITTRQEIQRAQPLLETCGCTRSIQTRGTAGGRAGSGRCCRPTSCSRRHWWVGRVPCGGGEWGRGGCHLHSAESGWLVASSRGRSVGWLAFLARDVYGVFACVRVLHSRSPGGLLLFALARSRHSHICVCIMCVYHVCVRACVRACVWMLLPVCVRSFSRLRPGGRRGQSNKVHRLSLTLPCVDVRWPAPRFAGEGQAVR